jgi:tetratricopeptide (TPR) repeat protein
MEDYPKAIEQYDLWIAAHPDDNRQPMALNGRCWARAMANVDLNRALKDCNGALSRMAHSAALLDSRAMVRLRMGDYPHALADYDEALKAGSDTAWTHYGRGIAELKLGRKADGDADIAMARSLDAEIIEQAKKRGIVP